MFWNQGVSVWGKGGVKKFATQVFYNIKFLPPRLFCIDFGPLIKKVGNPWFIGLTSALKISG